MDNNLYILCKQPNITLTRCHIVTWDIENGSFYTEYGFEVDRGTLNKIDFQVYIPKLGSNNDIIDLQSNICAHSDNCRLIFNSEILNSPPICGRSELGYNIELTDRLFSFVPISDYNIKSGLLEFSISIDKKQTKQYKQIIYIRFLVKTKKNPFSSIKPAANKKIFNVELRVNERRSIPDIAKKCIQRGAVEVSIEKCYCFHIIPVEYNLDEIDSNKRNIRELESKKFQNYLGPIAVNEKIQLKENSYNILFLKAENLTDYIFKSKFSKERFGLGQFIYSLSTNVIAGILLALVTFNKEQETPKKPFIIYSILIVICISTFLPWNRWYKKIFHK